MVKMPEGDGEYRKIAEAALFAAGKALTIEELSSITGVSSIGYLKNMMEQLIKEYDARNSAITITKIGDSYMMSVKDEYAPKVSGVAGSPDLSKGALRILAYVSSEEPVMQSQVVKAFGPSVYDYIKELSEKDFVSAVRIGRSKRITTTKKFREYFNIPKKPSM